MNEEKELWYQSKTVWGSLIVMILGIMQTFNIAGIDKIAAEKESMIDTLSQIGVIVAGLIAMWGRLTAKKKVVFKKEK